MGTEKKLKAAVYCRLSEEDRDRNKPAGESRSIITQKAMLRDYAYRQGWEIFDFYSDDDYSGADSKRPEYNRLLSDARARKFDIILCKHQSRFTRDMVHVEKYINEKFSQWGIRYVSILDGADTELAGNKKSRQINGLVNEWYLEDLSENIRRAYMTRKKEGKYLASCPVYGYKRDPHDPNHLIIDEPAAQIVRRIFRMYIEGMSMNAVARVLNEEGILPPARYKTEIQGINFKGAQNLRHKGKYRGQSMWQSSSINRILKNETYTGGLYQNRQQTISYKNHTRINLPREEWIIAENTHEAIVSREIFQQAAERSKKTPHIKKNGESSLFAGMLVCGYCGGAVVSNSRRADNYRYYRCHYGANLKTCRGICVSEKLLKEAAQQNLKAIFSAMITEEDAAAIAQKIKIPETTCALQTEERLELKKEELRMLTERKAKLYADMSDGVISGEDYKELSEHFSERQRTIKEEIKALTDIAAADKAAADLLMSGKKKKAQVVREAVDFCLECEELTTEMVHTFVDRIEVTDGEKRGQKQLKIFWNF